MVGEHAHQHDRARHGDRETEHDARLDAPAESGRYEHSQGGSHCDLGEGPGHGEAPHRQELACMELEPHSEHEEDDPDLRELLGDVAVHDKSGRERPNHDAGREVTDDRRKPQTMRDEPKEPCGGESAAERQDETKRVHHAPTRLVPAAWRPEAPGSTAARGTCARRSVLQGHPRDANRPRFVLTPFPSDPRRGQQAERGRRRPPWPPRRSGSTSPGATLRGTCPADGAAHPALRQQVQQRGQGNHRGG